MGLGRSFSVRSLGATATVLVAALIAPPPTHNHIEARAALESRIAHPCTADGAVPHLHPAHTTPAPECPACAAGPAAVGTVAHTELTAALCVRPAARPAHDVAPSPWVPPHRPARAPPASRLAA